MRIAVTGAAGFIGSALSRYLAACGGITVHGLDKLTYAASPLTVAALQALPCFTLHQLDITDRAALAACFAAIQPDAIIHLAAETHVDRSIDATAPFITTNIIGTHSLLEAALAYQQSLPPNRRAAFRFLHVSTDEVYGSLGATGHFTTNAPHAPNSPYAASKAAAEDLARAWHKTYDLPVLITNCSNNYGAYQFPEKLIPHMILKGLQGQPMPIYGKGDNIREWLHVSDMAAGLHASLIKGQVGEKYHLGSNNEISNLNLVQKICTILDQALPENQPHDRLMTFVTDRPGHDFRYALDCSATFAALGWQPQIGLDDGLSQTVAWYIANQAWWQQTTSRYRGDRLGLVAKG